MMGQKFHPVLGMIDEEDDNKLPMGFVANTSDDSAE